MVLVPHMRTTGFAKVQALLKTPIKTTEAVYSVKSISYLHSSAHLHSVVSDESSPVNRTACFSDDSSERL